MALKPHLQKALGVGFLTASVDKKCTMPWVHCLRGFVYRRRRGARLQRNALLVGFALAICIYKPAYSNECSALLTKLINPKIFVDSESGARSMTQQWIRSTFPGLNSNNPFEKALGEHLEASIIGLWTDAGSVENRQKLYDVLHRAEKGSVDKSGLLVAAWTAAPKDDSTTGRLILNSFHGDTALALGTLDALQKMAPIRLVATSRSQNSFSSKFLVNHLAAGGSSELASRARDVQKSILESLPLRYLSQQIADPPPTGQLKQMILRGSNPESQDKLLKAIPTTEFEPNPDLLNTRLLLRSRQPNQVEVSKSLSDMLISVAQKTEALWNSKTKQWELGLNMAEITKLSQSNPRAAMAHVELWNYLRTSLFPEEQAVVRHLERVKIAEELAKRQLSSAESTLSESLAYRAAQDALRESSNQAASSGGVPQSGRVNLRRPLLRPVTAVLVGATVLFGAPASTPTIPTDPDNVAQEEFPAAQPATSSNPHDTIPVPTLTIDRSEAQSP